jgi:hypothetical protein
VSHCWFWPSAGSFRALLFASGKVLHAGWSKGGRHRRSSCRRGDRKWCYLLRCICRFLARTRSVSMSALSPLLEHKRTQRGHRGIDAIDPQPTSSSPLLNDLGVTARSYECGARPMVCPPVRREMGEQRMLVRQLASKRDRKLAHSFPAGGKSWCALQRLC